MRYRSYGKSQIAVSEVGFGAWQLGNASDWSPMTHQESIQLVHTALQQGCTFFDTAPGYGHGASETLLGEALLNHRDGVVINTKVGHTAEGKTDFTPDGIRASVEASLTRLQTPYLDSVLLHNPPRECLYGDSPQMKVLQQLQDERLILAYGASVDSEEEMNIVLGTSGSQVLEVLFNVFFQEVRHAFEQAAEKQVGLVVKVPLDSGWLSGKYDSTSRFSDIRDRWSDDVIARRAQLTHQVRSALPPSVTMTQAALRFVLAHPEVSTVIPGSKNINQWQENASATEATLPTETVQWMHQFWRDELADNPLPW